jgi:large subunit ribosomal protein L3
MSKIIGQKVNMTQIFTDAGVVFPVTLVKLEAGVPEAGESSEAEGLKEGDLVVVSGISKGKGFQGVVKRHGFHGGPRTHGQKHSEREPGSIGGGLRTRVPKGMRMAGRMGNERVTVKNLRVIKVDAENKHLYISGAIPGRRGTKVEITAKKLEARS